MKRLFPQPQAQWFHKRKFKELVEAKKQKSTNKYPFPTSIALKNECNRSVPKEGTHLYFYH
jgi:hypothetical protein